MNNDTKFRFFIALILVIGILADYAFKTWVFHFLALALGLVVEVIYRKKTGKTIFQNAFDQRLRQAIGALFLMLAGIVAFIMITLVS